MKASYNWLREFVDFRLPPEELAHALTMAGFEVEGMSRTDNDAVFDINVTPNRPDCLSITGIAREISAILKIPSRSKQVDIRKQEGRGPEVEIGDTRLCRRYAARLITGVKPAPSPEWLIKRLEAHGFRTSLNIVDITNYVLLETGQPLHAFDLDKLSGRKIEVKTAGPVKKFHTLDNEDRDLNSEMLLIWDAEKPVALAGIMGGLNTEVSSSTVNILLESAYFYPSSVRRTSKSLGIASESSYRFERGADINNIVFALDRAAALIAEIAGGRISGLTDVYPGPSAARHVRISFEKINSVLGTVIPESFSEGILADLGFEVEREGGGFNVRPPGFREDIQTDVDVIEEIARLYGYDRIPATLPSIRMQPAPSGKKTGIIKPIKDSMTGSGFYEAINYSFFYPDALDKLNIPPADSRRDLVFIKNPLRKEESAMRTTLLPALLNNVALNINRGEKALRFFEVSRVFLPSNKSLPEEVVQMAAVCNQETSASLWQTRHDGFYDIKGAMENLFKVLRIRDFYLDQEISGLEPYLHPGKSCSIISGGDKIGSLGTVHPTVLEAFNIKGNLTVLEILDVEKLSRHISPGTTFLSLPRFPYVERDIAIVVFKDITAEQARNEISSIDSDLIESVTLFDVYTGKPIPQDRKSLAFSVRFRAADRTLTDAEVDSLHRIIVERLINKLNAELRS
ncbi:MAG: phenylalanine--tRNA ligase subunit beta [Nitrospiraceae bacterium]|nr:MAG: phenylalanine--tRNA ligase subunit beta [Nitrospiraceae bacterium]